MKKAVLITLFASLVFVAAGAQEESAAQASRRGHVGLPIDWSSNHVLHGNVTNQDFADAAGKEPRILLNYFRRQQMANASKHGKLSPTGNKGTIKRDWNWSLGSGTIAPNMSPAKYNFSVSSPVTSANCTSDFAVFGLNVAGVTTGAGTSQPNLVGFNNLYSGTTGSTLAVSTASIAGSTVTVTTPANASNWTNGSYVTVTGLTPSAYNGNYQITSATSATTFQYTVAANVGAVTSTAGATAVLSGLCGTVPSVAWAYNVTTATNGAIITSPSVSFDGTQVAFVESQMSKATITTATHAAATATITTSAAHGFNVGDTVVITGVSVAEYNGTFRIVSTPTTTTFTYSALMAPGGSGAGGTASVASGGAVFHVLTIGTSGDNGGWDAANNVYRVVTAGGGSPVNNASLTSVTYTASANTFSSPFIDYGSDIAYVGDNSGTLWKSNCVFACAAHSLTMSFTQVSTAAGVNMTSPIVDFNTSKVFYGSTDGRLYSVNLTTCVAPCAATSVAFANNTANGGITDAPLIDNQFQTVFVTSGDVGAGVGAVGEFNESLTSLATRNMGNAAFSTYNGVFSDAYYNNVLGSAVSATNPGGSYSTCGDNTGGSGQTALWSWSFSASAGTLSIANPPVLSAAALATLNLPGPTKTPCTTAIEFKNGTDLQFFGQNSTSKCVGSGNSSGDGCLLTYALSAAAPPAAPVANKQILVHGGPSAVVVDNTSTASQASSIYYSNEAVYTLNSINPCTYTLSNTASYCAFKVTQTGLQ